VRILVTGISGQVGHDLLGTLAPLGEVVGVDRAAMDLAAPETMRAALRALAPTLIVNPAAYTAVDRAETEPELAMRINAEAPAVLAEEARRLGAWLVHYSTDYVFDGSRHGPYREDDPPAPLGAYGRSKRAGEEAIAASGCAHLILRTSWVYSLRGRNFLTTLFRLASERDTLRVVADQVGAPTSSQAIARATARLAERIRDGTLSPGDGGLFHMTCGGSTSWHGFAQAIMDRLPAVARALGEPAPGRVPAVLPIRTEEYPTPARRPANSVLDNGKLERVFGVRLPLWSDALDALLSAPGAAGA
jgi:dTDP-4-dehydrorhamnose reductase